jgi:hypothetical protein
VVGTRCNASTPGCKTASKQSFRADSGGIDQEPCTAENGVCSCYEWLRRVAHNQAFAREFSVDIAPAEAAHEKRTKDTDNFLVIRYAPVTNTCIFD